MAGRTPKPFFARPAREAHTAPGRHSARSARTDTEPQRLQKVLALAGLGSRRDMENLIASGRITVNGQVPRMGTKVSGGDLVKLDQRKLYLPFDAGFPRVLMYHKPEGEIVSREDGEQRASVFDKLPRVRGGRWVSIGRLDINTAGLLLFTTSGELANRLMHPRYEVEREYAVRVMGVLRDEQRQQLLQGIVLEDGLAQFRSVQDNGGEGSNHWYQVVLCEGRNREVRRLFEAVGLMVSRLMRVRFGMISLPPRVKRGQMLEMPAREVANLLDSAGIPHGVVPQQFGEHVRRQQRVFTPKARAEAAPAVRGQSRRQQRSREGIQEPGKSRRPEPSKSR